MAVAHAEITGEVNSHGQIGSDLCFTSSTDYNHVEQLYIEFVFLRE